MLDQAFEALKTYDWGVDPKVLQPIDDAVIKAHDDSASRQELETRLAATLNEEMPLSAKQYVCRKLMRIGTAHSVPPLSALLSDEKLSHMARYALERMTVPEAAAALRDAVSQVAANLKVGLIGSLGSRQDGESVAMLGKLLAAGDAAVARSAALALGAIRSPEAARVLSESKPADAGVKIAATDASLACAEALLGAGKKADALVIYKGLAKEEQPKHVRLAATRGMLACAGK